MRSAENSWPTRRWKRGSPPSSRPPASPARWTIPPSPPWSTPRPKIATVGLTEEEARADGREVRIGEFPFMANGRARCLGKSEGLVKVVADAATDRLLGLHIFGPRASDLISEASLAMEFEAAAEDIALSVHAHPTLPEALKEAALASLGRALHI